MSDKSITIFSKKKIINFLFFLLPFSFIAGNLLINLNILLIIFFSFFFYKSKPLKLNFILIDKILIYFFIYLTSIGVISTSYNFFYENLQDFTVILKTLTFIRFLILYFIIRYLIYSDILNIKILFIACSLGVFLIIFDVIFQFIFGVNIIGYEKIYPRHVTSFFVDEAIAGSYIQRFSFFLLFLIPIFFKEKNKINLKLLTVSLLILIFFSLIAAGNRMPVLLFLFSLFLVLYLQKYLRKYILYTLIVSTITFTTLYNFFPNIKVHYGSFAVKSYEIITSVAKGGIHPEKSGWLFHGHFKEFYAGYETWKLNKFFGEGIKSFKYNCPKTEVGNCGPHPHNYYIEMMADLGLVGLFFFTTLYLIMIYKIFIISIRKNIDTVHSRILNLLFILFFIEIFPIKTTGSFFTTGNATYFFLIFALTVALSEKYKLIEKSK